ncbi:uncharacterized protein B0H64DRAFT_330401 [Chaetomium fimeti]|uniref:Uncharacterized protein n=1 Tax=Chaetomium fimeti TaxID=1854472 RepID=A0AAE0H7Z8_9PEZI|nr:hypothetical protein B0H64DRAFT_330401 [Chaetomium fimeti]
MHVYVGKVNWYDYAKDECITIVFPAGFAVNDPVCAYWQWTVDTNGNKKSNTTQLGLITSVTKTAIEYGVRFAFDYYAFEGVVSEGLNTLSLTMSNPSGDKSNVSLSKRHGDAVRIPTTSVFTGKLHWFEYSQDEMATLVIPGDVADGEPVILSHQWTKDGEGNPKANHTVSGTMTGVQPKSDGTVSAQFNDGYYTYNFTMNTTGTNLLLRMANPSNDRDSNAPYSLKRTDFRDTNKKKGLILRFGTSTDNGIFTVQEMLVERLGFAEANVEMVYFDVDPATGPKRCTLGQDPPTATNFKSKFAQLCKDARPGDVRFLYVDAHGTTFPDEESGESDGMDEGWILAENEDGTRKEVVSDDWLADAIRENLEKGVNLTILTSSCMGGGMLDKHSATPGVLLAGCHETQFNVKALKGRDPWMVGITTVIKNNIRRKRGIPTYSVLFNDAKKFIKAQLANGQLGKKYQGPSPNELEPIPRDEAAFTSHQDPQLIFDAGYIDPNEERFLVPFVLPTSGEATGDASKYPRDEYPHDEL